MDWTEHAYCLERTRALLAASSERVRVSNDAALATNQLLKSASHSIATSYARLAAPEIAGLSRA